MAKLPKTPRGAVGDLRGGVKLAIDGVRGVTDIVEAVHSRIARVPPPLGTIADAPTRGITGFVYRSIRGTTGLVGKGLDTALAGVQVLLKESLHDLPEQQAMPKRDAVVSAVNGVVGDHLERTGNPLAIQMRLIPRTGFSLGPKVVVLIHGLCMNDQQWTRDGHDHGLSIAQALGYTPVYARYNSGRHISDNAIDLATQLEQLLADWPVPVVSLAIIGHSMGGLVARSAVHQAEVSGMTWPASLRHLVFLGSPHHGAPLERGGNWLHRGLGVSPYVAPIARLSGLRSAGITDLRHGNLLKQDWADDRFTQRDTRAAVPLPASVACYAVAGTLGESGKADEWLGDGLVQVASALGRHEKPTRDLHIAPSRTFVARGVNHLDLLSSPAVYQRLQRWLAR